MIWRKGTFKKNDGMSKHIEIRLDPLTDGFTENKAAVNAIRADRHALIIATNGDFRLTDIREADTILRELAASECSGSIILADVPDGVDFLVIFNDHKAFELEEGRFFVGSMLVLKMEGKRLQGLTDEEVYKVKDMMEGRMATLVDGGDTFSALALF